VRPNTSHKQEPRVSLARAIYERWQTEGRLTALVPGDRVFTGRAGGETSRPYAVIAPVGARPEVHTTHATIETSRFEISAWLEPHADAQWLLEELRRAFHRTSFVAESAECLLMQCEEEKITPEEFDGWRAVAVYRAVCRRPVTSAS
jgi:hypothetical protein